MKIITFEDICSLNISPEKCFEWAEQMIKEKNNTILPPKISMKPYEGVFCNVMPSFISLDSDMDYGGIKVVTRYPNRVPSLESDILLFDAKTGTFLALMDGTWITAMRTGAVAAHSIKLFAKKDFKTIGMMGLGNVSRATLLILATIFKDREFNIKLLKYKNQEISMAERFKSFNNLHISFVDTPQEMAKGSDVVVSGATYLHDDVCPDDCFDEGVLLLPIHTRGFTNCDLFFDKVYADDFNHVKDFKYFNKFRSFAEVSDVVNNVKSGRDDMNQRILVYNIGVSIHDVYYASSIYKLLKQNNMLDSLTNIDTNTITEKFWV